MLVFVSGEPEGIRTPDNRLRRPMLYPTELLARTPLRVGAGDGNRTHAASLEGWNSTIEQHPHTLSPAFCAKKLYQLRQAVSTIIELNYYKLFYIFLYLETRFTLIQA